MVNERSGTSYSIITLGVKSYLFCDDEGSIGLSKCGGKGKTFVSCVSSDFTALIIGSSSDGVGICDLVGKGLSNTHVG